MRIHQYVKKISGDLETPTSLYLKIKGSGPSFLLESADGVENIGRYSMIGCDPLYRLIHDGKKMTVINNHMETIEGKVYDCLRKVMNRFEVDVTKEVPVTFGAVGSIAYETIKQYEKIPSNQKESFELPEFDMIIPKKMAVYDHLYRTIYLIGNSYSEEEAKAFVKSLEDRLSRGLNANALDFQIARRSIRSNFTQEEFEDAVKKAKNYIVNGDIFQVVLSQKFQASYDEDPFKAYRRLRQLNPSPYMYYFDFGDYNIVGASPESLVHVKEGFVSTNPIAGTRKRGKTEEEDKKLMEDLLSDEKELAEHLMLVDLGRNDIGCISEFGTVEVVKFMAIQKYSHVMHIASNVEGKMSDKFDMYDAVEKCLPAGTVSGAPKIRAMEIIEELENSKRELYAGAIGYFNINGTVDTAITIRTMIFKDEKVFFNAGAGIVYDSDPTAEFYETIQKASALMEAIGGEYDSDN